MIDNVQDTMSILDMSLLGSDLNFIENEIEILKSRSTAELVINRLFDSEYRDSLFLLKTKKYKSNKIRNLLTLGLLDNFQTLINYVVQKQNIQTICLYSNNILNFLYL